MPGPIDPITKRVCSGVVQASAASRAIRAAASDSSRIRLSMPYSARFA